MANISRRKFIKNSAMAMIVFMKIYVKIRR